MKAVHFGAGNIGRGFVGYLLKDAGYELVFSDVNSELIDAINAQDSYIVHEVGTESRDIEISGFSGINSAKNPEELAEAIATADVVTTAVGPNILKFVAVNIADGLRRRAESGNTQKVAVMACENAINATDILAAAIRENYAQADDVAIFANTAVDRIVPNQAPGSGLDVTVETYYEWAIETGPFNGSPLAIAGATWVDDLAPYITRKLYTVNTGHAATAYFGYRAGIGKISDAIENEEIRSKVEAALAETKNLVVRVFGFEPEVQQAYVDKILNRFVNPYLPDTAERVGRSPLRKISRHERFIGPAAELAEMGQPTEGLLAAVEALLGFDSAEDAEAQELQAKLDLVRSGQSPLSATITELTGIETSHPLYAPLEGVFNRVLA